jgi:hypothetical protein
VVFSAIHAAATMLQLDQKKQSESQAPSSAEKQPIDSGRAFFYSDFKASFWKVAQEVERSVKNSPLNQSKERRRAQVQDLGQKMIDFYKIFDKWHCGLNQLKTFKKLSFSVSVASPSKVK